MGQIYPNLHVGYGIRERVPSRFGVPSLNSSHLLPYLPQKICLVNQVFEILLKISLSLLGDWLVSARPSIATTPLYYGKGLLDLLSVSNTSIGNALNTLIFHPNGSNYLVPAIAIEPEQTRDRIER